MTRVLLVGETNPGGLTGSYQRAFASAGCAVEVFDYYGCLERAVPFRLPRLLRQAALAGWRPTVERRLAHACKAIQPDLVFILKCDDLSARVYSRLRLASPGVTLAAFHPDDPFNAQTLLRRGPSHPRAMVQMAAVDHYFVWSDHLVEAARRRGARAAHYLAFGVDPMLHAPVVLRDEEQAAFGADVAFVGNWDEKRDRFLDAFQGSGLRLAVWGTAYWRDRCRSEFVRAAWRGREAVGADFARVAAASAVCLNVLRPQNVGGHNMRTFEIPACGGVQLAEWSADQERHFAPGREALYFRTRGEMVEAAGRLLASPSKAEGIRAAGLARSARHGYEQRVRRVLQASELLPRAVEGE